MSVLIEFFKTLKDSGLLTAAFIIGAVSVIMAIVGKFQTVVDLSPRRAIALGMFGVILIVSSIGSYFVSLQAVAASNASIESIVGVWSGTTRGGDANVPINFTITKSCAIGSTCGSFNLPSVPCSGTFKIISISGSTFQFLAENKQGACGIATQDLLVLLPDGKLQYISRGNYPTSEGILQRVAK